MGAVYTYGLDDLEAIAAGAAILASGGGGSYGDACTILGQLAQQGVQAPVAQRLRGTTRTASGWRSGITLSRE